HSADRQVSSRMRGSLDKCGRGDNPSSALRAPSPSGGEGGADCVSRSYDLQLLARVDECLDRGRDVGKAQGRAELRADAGLALRHHRIEETGDIDAALI